MDFLTLPGNNSAIPYQKNECSLYSESGACFIYKGWAIITDGGDSYEAVLYDGIIDLYKTFENKTLAELDFSDLQHPKNVTQVKLSWDINKPYRYILADYNGDTGNTNGQLPEVDIDYLVPSVNIAWLWNLIFSTFNIGYKGAVFNMQEFKNLWLTYPQGISSGDSAVDIFESSDCGYKSSGGAVLTYYIGYNSWETNEIVAAIDNRHLKVAESGYYRVEISGNVETVALGFQYPKKFKLYLGRNSQYTPPHQVQQSVLLADNITPGEDFSLQGTIHLNTYDTVCVLLGKASNTSSSNGFYISEVNALSVKLIKVEQNKYDFRQVFSEFSIKDFMTEIVQRFGLTIFKNKYENTYEFLTLQEQLQTAETENWSKKFSKTISEKYTYGSYARQNWLRYSYNDKEGNYNDGFLDIDNTSLEAAKDIFKSKIYSPEKFSSNYLNARHNIYKLWEKETEQEDGIETVKYKPLDKRFYLMRAENITQEVRVKSTALEEELQVTNLWVENYWKLPFYDIIQGFYNPLRQILKNAVITTAELYLTEADIANLDLRKLYYIEQLAGYFIINKINNYIPGKPVKCDLVKVNYSAPVTVQPPAIAIHKVVVNNYILKIYFEVNNNADTVTLDVSYDGQQTWNSSPMVVSQNPRHFSISGSSDIHIRMEANGEYSEIVPITIPSNTTIFL